MVKRLLILFLVLSCVQVMARKTDNICEGDSLPVFSVVNQYGDTIRSSDFCNKVSLIVFFHTRCYDCRRELPVVQELYTKYEKEIQLICISRAESAVTIEPFWKARGLTMPYSAQEDKRIFKQFAEKTIPRIYLIDSKGIVRRVFKEKVRKKKIDKAILRLLEQK